MKNWNFHPKKKDLKSKLFTFKIGPKRPERTKSLLHGEKGGAGMEQSRDGSWFAKISTKKRPKQTVKYPLLTFSHPGAAKSHLSLLCVHAWPSTDPQGQHSACASAFNPNQKCCQRSGRPVREMPSQKHPTPEPKNPETLNPQNPNPERPNREIHPKKSR